MNNNKKCGAEFVEIVPMILRNSKFDFLLLECFLACLFCANSVHSFFVIVMLHQSGVFAFLLNLIFLCLQL